ncbi:MAG: type IV toxin-antitoxin system AbiEi family antitoxin [Alphaproteobacteria bacterium]|nr:type IV toxin-antitoxin system AbiEi family antitoxin [Alphaproteobacteria bacterium]
MSITTDKKLKNLLEQWPSGLVATSPWLKKMSISGQLAQRYLKSGWIESLGRAAYKRTNDEINWYGGLASLQQQLSLDVHLGGPTALSVKGSAHYVRLGKERVFLFSALDQKLPKWFLDYDWGNPIEHVKTSMLPSGIAVKEYEFNGMDIKISAPERAILECLYLSPKNFDLLECYQIMEGLTTLRPKVLQALLKRCSSIRVKRLFLYMADKAELPVLKHLNVDEIDLGKGDRMIIKNGVYNSKYKISLPKELVDYV